MVITHNTMLPYYFSLALLITSLIEVTAYLILTEIIYNKVWIDFLENAFDH